jgi:hypothetical protein
MDQDRAADFVRRFAEFWQQAPVVEHLDTVLAPDARLCAPMVSTTYGLQAGKRTFADLFELMPDMTAEVRFLEEQPSRGAACAASPDVLAPVGGCGCVTVDVAGNW